MVTWKCMFEHALSQYGWFGLRCVIVCWCETCFSSCISSWLQVSPPLVISSDLTHAHKNTHTYRMKQKMKAIKRWEQQTVFLLKMQIWTNFTHPWFPSCHTQIVQGNVFPLFFLWKGGILTLFIFKVGPIYLGTVIRWRLWMYIHKNV